MAKYSKKEFAGLCKQATNYLSVQIKRGKVIVENDEIDDQHPINKSYLEKIYGRLDFVPKSTANTPVKPETPNPSTSQHLTDDEIKKALELCGGMDYPTLERIYKFLQGEKLKSDIEKNKIDLEKKRGEVIPVGPVENLVFQYKQYVLTQMKIGFEKSLIEIGHKYSITSEDLAAYRGNNTKILNDAIAAASDTFVMDFEKNLSSFSIRKNVGEHG